MSQPPVLLFIYEYDNCVFLDEGKAPYTLNSHFTHMFLIAQEALHMGWRVFFKNVNEPNCFEKKAMYPVVTVGETVEFNNPDFQPNIMFAVNTAYTLVSQRRFKPNAIGAYILNAHFWLEAAPTVSLDYPDSWRLGIARDIDFILTQNDRMKELAFCLFNLIGKWPWRERILCAPNTFSSETVTAENARYDRATIRAEMNAKDDDIIIINSGGPWSWTDTDTLALAFVEVVREGAKRLKFFQMGIIQPGNTDQQRIVPFWQIFIDQNQDLIDADRLRVYADWQTASALLPAYNYGADVGVNVSRDTPENYQSHRVRLVDYTKAGLPVINTTGNYYATYGARDAVMLVEPGNVESYKKVLWQLERGEINLGEKRRAMAAFRDSIVGANLIPQVLKTMLAMGRAPADERHGLAQNLYGLYQLVAEKGFAEEFKKL